MEIRYAYIDWANLDKTAKGLGWQIDYEKFYRWLQQKYSLEKIFLFTGFVSRYQEAYTRMKEWGYEILFKETVTGYGGKVKGNADAELVLHATSDFYEKKFSKCIIISGDGDFKCLIDFLFQRSAITAVLAPSKERSSILIRRTPFSLVFLDDHYHKFSTRISSSNEKAPDADVSA